MKAEDIVKTETGMRMYKAVTPGIYNQDPLQLSIFNANGLIMDEVLQRALKMHIDLMIQNATWSLPYWEQLFRIIPQDNQTIEQRRCAVILKMNEFFPITKRRMEHIIDIYTENKGVNIDDKQGDYIFRINFTNPGRIQVDEMIKAIEEAKPAHLAYLFVVLVGESTIYLIDNSYHYPVIFPRTGEMVFEVLDSALAKLGITLQDNTYNYPVEFDVYEMHGEVFKDALNLIDNTYNYPVIFPRTGEMEPISTETTQTTLNQSVEKEAYSYKVHYPITGEAITGEGWFDE